MWHNLYATYVSITVRSAVRFSFRIKLNYNFIRNSYVKPRCATMAAPMASGYPKQFIQTHRSKQIESDKIICVSEDVSIPARPFELLATLHC